MVTVTIVFQDIYANSTGWLLNTNYAKMLAKPMLLRNHSVWAAFEIPENRRFEAITQFGFRNKALGMYGKFFM